ncbi:cyclic AMP phosphodiesterase [Luminiphilus syltensis NOR5-1B]|uniref:Cyclic AMP phosphodiesterase n=1 Tax=Luminiphilus syltensis NOR5-1B TaxID=565045 RepID=B8KUM1_9GAMM|nr:3',5'-cyclic-AMP phosphodiesterase [Luminiphilus syltensis]EED36039.1 cyclic AMP phosphodiesterase [Luminiphilus syltensis NOR5-1B]
MTGVGLLQGVEARQSGATLKLLQITDTHLMQQRGGRLLNVDTDASLSAVVALASQSLPADALLITGDIAGAGAGDAYYRLEEALSPLQAPSFWLPGNHDDGHACADELSWHFKRQVIFPHWQVLMLDSQVRGEVGGILAQAELDALVTAVSESNASGRHLLVALHHPLWPLGCDWLDSQRVANADDVAACLEMAENKVVVISGHVHQESDAIHRGARYLTTPSTCIQFAKYSPDFKVDDSGPGYRWLDLQADGFVSTGVERVTEVSFPVDLDSDGYL